MTNIETLRAALPNLPASKVSFATSLLAQFDKKQSLSDKQWPWVDKLIAEASKPAPVPFANIGDLSAINALFDKARQHLKYPAIVLNVPKANNMFIRISVAGERARFPGSLNVTSGDKPGEDGRTWFGRVHKNGNYEARGNAEEEIAERLTQFAINPMKVAKEYAEATKERIDGVLTGRCCFCNKHLQDERSTDVGYGKTCAKNYGLPWGAK
jgi:hypothetical protein